MWKRFFEVDVLVYLFSMVKNCYSNLKSTLGSILRFLVSLLCQNRDELFMFTSSVNMSFFIHNATLLSIRLHRVSQKPEQIGNLFGLEGPKMLCCNKWKVEVSNTANLYLILHLFFMINWTFYLTLRLSENIEFEHQIVLISCPSLALEPFLISKKKIKNPDNAS